MTFRLEFLVGLGATTALVIAWGIMRLYGLGDVESWTNISIGIAILVACVLVGTGDVGWFAALAVATLVLREFGIESVGILALYSIILSVLFAFTFEGGGNIRRSLQMGVATFPTGIVFGALLVSSSFGLAVSVAAPLAALQIVMMTWPSRQKQLLA